MFLIDIFLSITFFFLHLQNVYNFSIQDRNWYATAKNARLKIWATCRILPVSDNFRNYVLPCLFFYSINFSNVWNFGKIGVLRENKKNPWLSVQSASSVFHLIQKPEQPQRHFVFSTDFYFVHRANHFRMLLFVLSVTLIFEMILLVGAEISL